MSDTLNLIIAKIAEGKTMNEMCTELNLSRNRLHYYLGLIKNSGFQFSTVYEIDGEIKFSLDAIKMLYEYNGLPFLNVHIPLPDSKAVKALAISDLHFGNELERRDAVDAVFNYCIKNNIHLILCCGDILDGTFTGGKQVIINGMEQVEYFIQNYPYDKNIVTLAVLGDHDFSILNKYKYNPAQIITKNRSDIAIGGYDYSFVRMRNDKITLHHKMYSHLPMQFSQISSNLILCGHYHNYTASIDNGILNINVPTLSSINTNVPSALELELTFKDNLFNEISTNQLVVVNGNVEKVSSVQFYIGAGDAQDKKVNNNSEKQKILKNN